MNNVCYALINFEKLILSFRWKEVDHQNKGNKYNQKIYEINKLSKYLLTISRIVEVETF